MSKGGSSQPTISTYYAGIQFILCHGPIDKITKIRVDEREAWTGISTGGSITVNAPELFGGNAREGGVAGTINLNFGLPSQTKDSYLTSILGSTIPAFRGVVTAVLAKCYIGNNYYLKPWAFLGTRIHKRKNGATQWQDSLAEVGASSGLINAVHVIRECLTDDTWGLGYSEAQIDETTFLAAAQTCYDEGLGFSFLWTGESSVNDFIAEVSKHILGSLYLNRTTGKWQLTLARPVTSPSSLVLLNEANVKEVTDFNRKSLVDLISSVTVKFQDNTTFQDNTVNIQDSSLAQRQGATIEKEITYSGVVTLAVAQKLAVRDLKQLSVPLYSCSLKCNRDAENLNIGDAFRLYWPDYIPDTLVMRVVSINLGTSIKQEISIECIQDVFSAPDFVYSTPPGSVWDDPVHNPTDLTYKLINETPYYIVATAKGDNFAQSVATTDTFIVAAGVAPTNDSFGAGIYTTTGSIYDRHGNLDFCFSSTLTGNVSKTATSIAIADNVVFNQLTTGHFIQIGNELLGVTAISGTTLTVQRGVLDTVPEIHSTGDRLYAWHDFSDTDGITYVLGETVHCKLTTITPKGELLLASATPMDITTIGRMHLPYPPGNVKLNDSYWPSTINLSTTATTDNGYLYTSLLLQGEGATIVDSSTINNKTLTITGGVTTGTPHTVFGAKCLQFDGTGYITTNSSSDFDFSTDFTICGWIYCTTLTAAAYVLWGTHSGINDGKTACYVTNSGKIAIGKIGIGELASATGIIAVNTLYFVEFVKIGSTTTIRVNGLTVASATTNFWSTGTAPLLIGYANPANANNFIGAMDSVRVLTNIGLYTQDHLNPAVDFSVTGTIPLYYINATSLVITWATRNRLQQTANLIDYYTTSITSEVGVTYSGELRRTDTNAILESFSGNTGTTITLTPSYSGQVKFEIWAVRSGLSSFQKVSHIFTLV